MTGGGGGEGGRAFWACESADSATEHARRPTWRERGHACRYRFVFMSSILLSSAKRLAPPPAEKI